MNTAANTFRPSCSTGACDCGCDYLTLPVVAPVAAPARRVSTPTPVELAYAASVEEDEG